MLKEAKIKKAFEAKNFIDDCKFENMENLDLDENFSIGPLHCTTK
jgi:hypothetical protein